MLKKLFTDTLPALSLMFCQWVLLAFVVSIFTAVTMRYGFDLGFVKLQDFTAYAFGVLVMMCVYVAFFKDAHVRVNFTSFMKPSFDTTFCKAITGAVYIIVAVLSLFSVAFSWSIFEGSKEPDGLAGFFLVKTMLPISFFLISLFLLLGGGKSGSNKSTLEE